MSDSSLVGRVGRRLRLDAARAIERLREATRLRRNASRVFRPLFVTGAIGSGTSLLAASLSQQLCVAGSVSESAREVARGSCLWIDRLDHYPSLEAYERQLAPGPDWSADAVRGDLQRLYRAKAQDPTRAVIVDKGPNANLVRAAFLAGVFPDSSFVMIFRDPVANIEGFRRKWRTFGDEPLAESVRFWRTVHESFLADSESFAERLVTVEYEALVADYDAVLARLADVLGIDRAERARPVSAREVGAGRGLRGVSSGRIHVVPDANARAYTSLTHSEVAEIRAAVAPVHERLRARARASGFGLEPAPGGEAEA